MLDRIITDGPERIIAIRHGEKPPAFGGPAGIAQDGQRDHHSLTVRGWQRAGALVARLCRAEPELGCPTAIFSPPRAGDGGDHSRPYQTIAPLAERLGLAVDDTHKVDEEETLVASVRQQRGIVLIAWEHKRIPRIASLLADPATVPQSWPDDRFDLFWIFDRAADGNYTFRQQPQQLLGGDSTELVPVG